MNNTDPDRSALPCGDEPNSNASNGAPILTGASPQDSAQQKREKARLRKELRQRKKQEEEKLWREQEEADRQERWAYQKMLSKWLLSQHRTTECGDVTPETVRQWYGTKASRNFLGDKLRLMPYRDFLQTNYWKVVADFVKRKAGMRCQLCNLGGGSVHTHHRTYRFHGREHEHVEDLICLCANCHSRFHNKLERPPK
jgi:hypothetical protein